MLPETLTTNQLKDSTIYGDFYNASKNNAVANATFRKDIHVNGDLYLGTRTVVVDPETGLESYVSTGGMMILPTCLV